MTQLPAVNSNLPQNSRWSQQPKPEEDFATVASVDSGTTRRPQGDSGNPAYILNLSKEAREMLRRQRERNNAT